MQGQGRLQGQRQRLQRQELLQGQGWLRNRRLQAARRKETSLTRTFHWRVCPDRGLVKIAGPPSSLWLGGINARNSIQQFHRIWHWDGAPRPTQRSYSVPN